MITPPPLSHSCGGDAVSFLDVLKLITSFGPKLKDAWPKIQAILALVLELKALLEKDDSTVGVLQSVALDEAEVAELDQIAALVGGPTAAVDLSALTGLAGLFKGTIGKVIAALLAKALERYLEEAK